MTRDMLFRGLGLLKITLIATIIQIPIRIAVSWLLAGTLGIGGVSVGMIAGWVFMIAYEGFMIKSSVNCRRQTAAYISI